MRSRNACVLVPGGSLRCCPSLPHPLDTSSRLFYPLGPSPFFSPPLTPFQVVLPSLPFSHCSQHLRLPLLPLCSLLSSLPLPVFYPASFSPLFLSLLLLLFSSFPLFKPRSGAALPRPRVSAHRESCRRSQGRTARALQALGPAGSPSRLPPPRFHATTGAKSVQIFPSRCSFDLKSAVLNS